MTPRQKPASFPVPFSRIHHQIYGIFKEEIRLAALLEAGCLPALEISRYYCWAEEAPGCWPLTAWGWHISCSNRQQMGTRCGGPFVRLSGSCAPARGKVWGRQGWVLCARTANTGPSGGGGYVCSYRSCLHRLFPMDRPQVPLGNTLLADGYFLKINRDKSCIILNRAKTFKKVLTFVKIMCNDFLLCFHKQDKNEINAWQCKPVQFLIWVFQFYNKT